MRKWLIQKIVEAPTLIEALNADLHSEPVSVQVVVPNTEQLEPAIGTDATANDSEYEESELGFKQ